MADEDVPRKTINTDPSAQLWEAIHSIERALTEIQRAATLRNASISGGTGIRLLEEAPADGAPPKLRIWINPDGTITAFNITTGQPVVRMGLMVATGGIPGNSPYGIEVFVNGTWMQMGTQTVTWNSVQGAPATYTPSPHTHPGSDILSAVAQADGSQYAFNNTVAGTTFYAVWVGNDGGYHLGRNTSSIRFKENVRPLKVDKGILGVQPVVFDRKPRKVPPPAGTEGPANLVNGNKNEYGVIAEDAHQCFPQATQYYEGQIDGVRYELYGVALVPIVNEHEKRIAELEQSVRGLEQDIKRLKEGITP